MNNVIVHLLEAIGKLKRFKITDELSDRQKTPDRSDDESIFLHSKLLLLSD